MLRRCVPLTAVTAGARLRWRTLYVWLTARDFIVQYTYYLYTKYFGWEVRVLFKRNFKQYKTQYKTT